MGTHARNKHSGIGQFGHCWGHNSDVSQNPRESSVSGASPQQGLNKPCRKAPIITQGVIAVMHRHVTVAGHDFSS